MRVDLPGDGERSQACEALQGRKLGTGHDSPPLEEWYALSIRFPANYTTSGSGLSLAQLNFQAIWGAPLSLSGQSPTASPPRSGMTSSFTSSGRPTPPKG